MSENNSIKSTLKVLVVEDHLIARKIAVAILESLHCEVDTADNGMKALEKVMTNHYHLMLVDIGLPCIDGFELVKKIRENEAPLHTHVPIIALTAHTDAAYRAKCIEAGMNDCHSKPLTTENARLILETFIQRYAS